MPPGVLGLKCGRCFKGYLRYIANRRCQQIGWSRCSKPPTIRFPGERDDRLKKERNFFETRVTSTRPEAN